ncbi:MAG: glycosyltransferase family 4 protein [Chloroflexi bacterium]|nr:glycosyltransferase family 4 protein [Chloroflexota bacterium]
MRILICNYEYPPLGGGGGVATKLLAEDLAKRHEVTILTSKAADLPADAVEDGVRVLRAPVLFRRQKASADMLSMIAYIPMGTRVGKRLLSAESFDVINTHFALPSGPVGDSLSRFGRIPNVLTVHGGDLYDPSKFTSPHRHAILRAWIRRLLRKADVVVGQSQNTLGNMKRYYADDVEGELIPLGIQRPPDVTASRREHGFEDDEVLLITVGRLVARKATSQLMTLMDRMRDLKLRLIVIGTGPEEAMLRADAASRGLSDRIRFTGFVDEVEKLRLLKISDMYVSTSQHEGFGLVLLEGIAFGLPVLCYDHGGQTDFLDDGETGYVLPLNDLQSFEDRCREMVKDVGLRTRMGAENLRRVEGLFIENCSRRYEEVFEAAVNRRTSLAFGAER